LGRLLFSCSFGDALLGRFPEFSPDVFEALAPDGIFFDGGASIGTPGTGLFARDCAAGGSGKSDFGNCGGGGFADGLTISELPCGIGVAAADAEDCEVVPSKLSGGGLFGIGNFGFKVPLFSNLSFASSPRRRISSWRSRSLWISAPTWYRG
jgi:hypothetical protein